MNNELLMNVLIKQFPKLRFVRTQLFGSEWIVTTFGRSRSLFVKARPDGKLLLEQSIMRSVDNHRIYDSYDDLSHVVIGIIKESNPDLVSPVQIGLF